MSWATLRDTTRKEDEAYSLFGNFYVNLPLLYGEGEKAFLRLQEAVLSRTSDHSILAWDNSETDTKLPVPNTPLRWKSRPNVLNDPWIDVEVNSGLLNQGESFLLAPDVYAFRYSGKFQWNNDTYGTTPLMFTPTGLHITLPPVDLGFVYPDLCKSPIPMFAAILDCRLHGGWIALKVYQWRNKENIYRVYRRKEQRLWYVDASIARRADFRDIRLWHSFVKDAEPAELKFPLREEPEQLILLLGDTLIRDNLLSDEASSPPDSWQILYQSQPNSGIRAANFSQVVLDARNPAYGAIVLRRKRRRFTMNILLRFLWPVRDAHHYSDTARRPVLRLQYWLDDKILPDGTTVPHDAKEECRCEEKVCPHRLENVPSGGDLSLHDFLSDSVPEECHCALLGRACEFKEAPNDSSPIFSSQDQTHSIARYHSLSVTRNKLLLREFTGCSHEDTIRLWPSDFTLHASLKNEEILGMRYKVLELECVEDEPYASSDVEELHMEE